jgi:hypothetical protein
VQAVLWISLAAAVYVLAGLWFYFSGFSFFKKLNERSRRIGGGSRNDSSATSASLFEPPRSRPLVVFFKGLGILVLVGVAFFLVMRHVSAPRP